MKKMKKLLSILVAATMTLAMAAPSFADDPTAGTTTKPTAGTITVQNATIGKTYRAYKLFNANPSGQKDVNGEDLIAYTADSKVVTWCGDDSPFTFTPVAGAQDLYNVGLKTGKDGDDVNTFLTSRVNEDDHTLTGADSSWELEAKTPAAGQHEVVWNNVPFGYYLVTSNVGSTITLTYTNFDATITDKNQGPTWGPDPDPENPDDYGKKIKNDAGNYYLTQSSENFDDIIDFQIKFEATHYNGVKIVPTYYVHDELGKGMEYFADNTHQFKVMVGETEVLSANSSKDGVVNFTNNDIASVVMANNEFTVTIDWQDNFAATTPITVQYSAKVKNIVDDPTTDEVDGVVIAGEGNKNTASVTFIEKDKPEDQDPEKPTPITGEKTTTSYVYALGIKKVNEAGVGLAGAQFTLKLGENVIKVSKVEDGVYKYDAKGSATIESDNDGMILIQGIQGFEENDDDHKYTLTEDKAPEGYNRLEAPVTVEAKLAETYVASYKYNYDTATDKYVIAENGSVEVKKNDVPISPVVVLNKRGALLPSTGGIGTTIFYAAGIILMAGAVFFVVRRKRA